MYGSVSSKGRVQEYVLRALGAKTLRESEGSQNGALGACEASPPASEASDEPRSGEQVALNAAHNTG